MSAIPAAAALGCRSCRQAVFRAILSSSAPRIHSHPSPPFNTQLPFHQRSFVATRSFSATSGNTGGPEPVEPTSSEVSETPNQDEPQEKPWFLEVEAPRHLPSQHQPTLPKAPTDAPSLVDPMIKYIYEDMGLDEISLLDLRELDPPAALGPNLIMLFATARSERHLHIAAGRFSRWIKREFKTSAKADGLIGAGELRTKLRRLRKKAKLMGTNTAIIPGGDNGISTGWVCVSFTYDGATSGESASFDASGHISGFGTSQTGTTIVVQCLTEQRRQELDLEALWKGILRRNLDEGLRIRQGKPAAKEELEEMVASKLQMSTTPAALQWQAMEKASNQHRYFSTAARQLRPEAVLSQPSFSVAKEPAADEHAPPADLGMIRQEIRHALLSGSDLPPRRLLWSISAILRAPADDSGSDRLALVDELLLTAQERGIRLERNDVLVALLDSVLTSPLYGPELQQVRKNLEQLLSKQRERLNDDEILRLMSAYALHGDWEAFWNAFRNPPRFCSARSSVLYEMAYRTMVKTGNRTMCRDAMRWVFPEMLQETQPIKMSESLFEAIVACMSIVDPLVHEMHEGEAGEQYAVASRKKNPDEFSVMYMQAIGLRKEFLREVAHGNVSASRRAREHGMG